MDRRQLLIGTVSTASTAASGGVLVLDPVALPAGNATITGHIPYGAPDWVYVPIEIPAGVNRLGVEYTYDRPAAPPGQNGNALDRLGWAGYAKPAGPALA